MVVGVVDEFGEATVPIDLISAQGEVVSLTAIVDTGFNGSLALPAFLAARLGLQPARPVRAKLGDGTRKWTPTYQGTVSWFGIKLRVRVSATKD